MPCRPSPPAVTSWVAALAATRPGTALAVLACAVAIASPAAAHADALVGADALDRGEHAVYAVAGLSDVEFGAMFGLSSLADVAPHVRFVYGQGTRVGGFGVGVGTSFRFRFAGLSGWRIAALVEPEILFHQGVRDHPPLGQPGSTSSIVALQLGTPALVASRKVGDAHVAIGLKAPIGLYVAPQASVFLPLVLHVAGEAPIAGSLTALALCDVGTVLYGSGGAEDAEVFLRLRAGIGWH